MKIRHLRFIFPNEIANLAWTQSFLRCQKFSNVCSSSPNHALILKECNTFFGLHIKPATNKYRIHFLTISLKSIVVLCDSRIDVS